MLSSIFECGLRPASLEQRTQRTIPKGYFCSSVTLKKRTWNVAVEIHELLFKIKALSCQLSNGKIKKQFVSFFRNRYFSMANVNLKFWLFNRFDCSHTPPPSKKNKNKKHFNSGLNGEYLIFVVKSKFWPDYWLAWDLLQAASIIILKIDLM